MSKRNSQEAKRAARERLRIERERQAKRDKVRRQVVVALSIVGVLVVAGGIGFAVMKANEPTGWEAAKEDKLVKPANAEGKDGRTIVLGGKDAKHTIDIWEDLRCPACAQFEQGSADILQKGADDGKYKLQVHFGDLIDGNLSGEGSKNAVSALGASLDVSMDAFREYHKKLYSAQHHPQETDDKFADDSYLLKVADTVPELKNDKGFEKAVKKGTYDKWALTMIDHFHEKGINGTPSVFVDGKKLDTNQLPNELAAGLEKLGVELSTADKTKMGVKPKDEKEQQPQQ